MLLKSTDFNWTFTEQLYQFRMQYFRIKTCDLFPAIQHNCGLQTPLILMQIKLIIEHENKPGYLFLVNPTQTLPAKHNIFQLWLCLFICISFFYVNVFCLGWVYQPSQVWLEVFCWLCPMWWASCAGLLHWTNSATVSGASSSARYVNVLVCIPHKHFNFRIKFNLCTGN